MTEKLKTGDTVEIIYPGPWHGKRGTLLRSEHHPFSRAGCHIIWEVALEDGEQPWAHATLLRRIEVAR